MFDKVGSDHPKFGKRGNSLPSGWKHSSETKTKLRESWLKRTKNGTVLGNLKFKMGEYISKKTGRREIFHSSYEKTRMEFLDMSQDVIDWTKQHGISIPYEFRDAEHLYIPDFLVTWMDGQKTLEEIKGFVKDQKQLFAKNMAAVSYAEDNGLIFRLLQKRDLVSPKKHRVFFLEGPDNCGKSHIGRGLSQHLTIPYFRFSRQHEMWTKNQFKTALEFDQPLLVSFLGQTKSDVIVDRGYASEFVYSKVFGRETNRKVLEYVDKKFSELGAVFLIFLRRDYSKNGGDVVVPDEKLLELHEEYLKFVDWTRCSCIVMYVDDLGNDLKLQVVSLQSAMDMVDLSVGKNIIFT